jgi:hypothetical protein
MMFSVLDVYYQEIEKNKVADSEEDKEDNLDATVIRVSAEDDKYKEMHKNMCTSALLLPE